MSHIPLLVDEETVSKIIPTLFSEMNDQFDRTRQTPRNTTTSFPNAYAAGDNHTGTQDAESVSIQSLLAESEQLDKVIPVIANINATVDQKVSKGLLKTQHTCLSTIQILNSWNDIFSQAGYFKKIGDSLMQHSNAGSPNTAAKSTLNVYQDKVSTLEILKTKLDELQKKKKSKNISKTVGVSNSRFQRGRVQPSILKKKPVTDTQTRSSTGAKPWLPQPKKRNLFNK